jgi:8-oxo-dGTP pyrophosphatase MutT (NUDIX family)
MNHSDQNVREDLPEFVTRRLHLPLPGAAAQRTMQPELSFGRHAGPAKPDARPAAVVVLLHQVDNQWFVPLMLRPKSLSHHAGQISLPGGVIEAGESSEEAALRELEEELGIDRFRSLLLGQLSPLYLFGTNFLITPWVAVVRGEVEFCPNRSEVEEFLQVPLSHLLSPTSRGEHVQQRGTLRFMAPHFSWREHRIWGATSMILAELVDVLRDDV